MCYFCQQNPMKSALKLPTWISRNWLWDRDGRGWEAFWWKICGLKVLRMASLHLCFQRHTKAIDFLYFHMIKKGLLLFSYFNSFKWAKFECKLVFRERWKYFSFINFDWSYFKLLTFSLWNLAHKISIIKLFFFNI